MYELFFIIFIFIVLILIAVGIYFGIQYNIFQLDDVSNSNEVLKTDIYNKINLGDSNTKTELNKTIKDNNKLLQDQIGILPDSNVSLQKQITSLDYLKKIIKEKSDKYEINTNDPNKPLNIVNNMYASSGLSVNTDDINKFKICDKDSKCIQFGMNNGTLHINPDAQNIQLGDNILVSNINNRKRVFIKDLYVFDGQDITQAPKDPNITKITNSKISTVYVIALKGYYDLTKEEQDSIKDIVKNRLIILPLRIVRNQQGLPETQQITDENTVIMNNEQYVAYPLSKVYVPVSIIDTVNFSNIDTTIPQQTIQNMTFGFKYVPNPITTTPTTPTTATTPSNPITTIPSNPTSINPTSTNLTTTNPTTTNPTTINPTSTNPTSTNPTTT